jgi:DNA-directed RNA polymerase subunit N (RpoN/RPB10)
MHSKGGEVRCELCGKMVKNKWYMRRHKVTHHGAPLRKSKKDYKQTDSDNEM